MTPELLLEELKKAGLEATMKPIFERLAKEHDIPYGKINAMYYNKVRNDWERYKAGKAYWSRQGKNVPKDKPQEPIAITQVETAEECLPVVREGKVIHPQILMMRETWLDAQLQRETLNVCEKIMLQYWRSEVQDQLRELEG